MSVLLLVLTDGRQEYLQQTLEAFDKQVSGPVSVRVLHDDSGDPAFSAWLRSTYPDFMVVSTEGRSGFDGAIRSAWAAIAAMGDYEWVFHLEEDFTFQRPVDLGDVIEVLTEHPELSQMAFRRQAWYPNEFEVGGFAEAYACRMVERRAGANMWLEHDKVFTTNPSLYRRGITKLGWPKGKMSEARFWWKLRTFGLPWGVLGDDVRSGLWGSMESGARWVEHIGHDRGHGHGY